jgi:TrmH family RNA methyltransferase
VRASMGSIFARPPALGDPEGWKVALDARAAHDLRTVELSPPVVLCLGSERAGLPDAVLDAADSSARVPLRADGPESLNVAMAATVALYEVANRMAAHA